MIGYLGDTNVPFITAWHFLHAPDELAMLRAEVPVGTGIMVIHLMVCPLGDLSKPIAATCTCPAEDEAYLPELVGGWGWREVTSSSDEAPS